MGAKKQEKKRPASYFIDYENVRGAGLNGVEALGKHDRVFVLYGSKDSALKLEQVQNVLASPAKVEFIKVATGKHDALDFQLVALMFLNMKKKRDYFIISKDTGFDFAIRMAKARGMNHVYRRETISGATLEPKKLPQPKGRPVKRLPQPAKPNAQQGRQNAPAKQQGAANAEAPAAQAPQQTNDDVATTPAAEAQPQQRTSKSSRRRRRKSSAQQPKPQKDQYRLDIERVLTKHMGGLPTAKKVEVILDALEKCETRSRFYNYLRATLGNEQGLALYREAKDAFDDLRAVERPAKPAPEAKASTPAE